MDLATSDLADAIFREKVLRARQQTPSEKWALCFELHELAIATMRSGIAAQHPELDAAGISIQTDNGTVTLTGKVPSWSERNLVEDAAWSVPGVAEVNDKLTIGV